jgi:hypothetical protein
MKTKTVAAILFAGVMAFVAPRPVSASVSVSIDFFHHELSPYGRWVYTSRYGEIWYPTHVRSGWAPYVDGEWVYTDCGWTWVSDDAFDAPFHYGTWVWVAGYGWCWEPGYVWGPAWVSWAWTDRYIGWAPLPPSFAITTAGYYGGAVTVPSSQYVFVPSNQFAGTNVSTVRVATAQNSTILAGAQRATRFSVSNGLVRAGGPPVSLVQRASGKPVRAVNVSSVSRKVRPTTIAAAGVRSGRRIPIAAPVRERAARAARLESKGGRVSAPRIAHRAAPPAMRAPRVAAVGRHGERLAHERAARIAPRAGRVERAPAHVAIARHAPEKHAVVARHEVRPSRESRAFAAGPSPRQAHHEKISSAPPPRMIDRSHEGPPPAAMREERRTAMNRAAEAPRPARHDGPPPQAFHERPGPPPGAMARPPEHAQPQPHPGGDKKEKGH